MTEPLSAGAPATTVIDGPQLDGDLRTLILPLVLEVPPPPAPGPGRGPGPDMVPFMPSQVAGLVLKSFDSPTRTWRSEPPTADVGFGLPALLATTRVSLHGDECVTFGASQETLEDAREGHEAERVWTVPAGVCVSLWWTADAVVLTVERLCRPRTTLAEGDLANVDLDTDLMAALAPLLRGTTHSETSTLEDVFGRTALKRTGLRRADLRVPIGELRVRGVDHIRGRAVTQGLFAVTAPLATPVVRDLTSPHREPEVQDLQEAGVHHTWLPLELAEKPAERGATSAVRSDGKVLLLNLEAASVNHCYRGGGSGAALLATLPVVAHRAALKRDRARLTRALQPTGTDGVPERLRTIETIHLSAARRALQKPELRPERFTVWTVVPRLASEVAALGAEEADELQSDLKTSADLAIGSLDRIREQRRHNVERWVQRLSPVAAISVLVGIYSALTAVPAPSQRGLVVAIPDALAVTAVLVVAGVVVGLIVDWALNTWRRDL